jgi:alanine racemase
MKWKNEKERVPVNYAEVNLDHLADNFHAIKRRVGDKVKMAPLVKAEAYGHGMIEAARIFQSIGADMLGVISVVEGVALREQGIDRPILVLSGFWLEEARAVVQYRLTPAVYDLGMAEALSRAAADLTKDSVPCHIKVDTGLNRLGVPFVEAAELTVKVSSLPNIEVEGIFSHFIFDEPAKEENYHQLKRFRRVLAGLIERGMKIPVRHMANSNGVLSYPDSWFDMVRPGKLVYGCPPKGTSLPGTKPVFSVKSSVFSLRGVPPLTPLSYNHTYKTRRDSVIATLPIGYADGLSRLLSSNGEVLIRGKRAPIVGVVCMNYVLLDVTDIPEAKVGDEVTILGRDGDEEITARDLAERLGVVPEEVLCRLGASLPRVYVEGGKRFIV